MASITDTDRNHLRRCVDLAAEGVAAGDEPFGSVLVSKDGAVLFEDRNRVSGGDETRHPELAAAQWAVGNMAPDERRAATVYTSGEHCAMCAAAHAWVGLGKIVYATGTAQLQAWRKEWDLPPGPVAPLPIQTVAPGLEVVGPVLEFADEVRALHAKRQGKA